MHRPPALLAAAAGTGALAKDQGQPVARAAWMMTPATTPGLEIMDRCGALIWVMCASARWAMNSWSAGVMAWSPVPTMAQDGIVAQAGRPGLVGERAGGQGPLGGGQHRAFTCGQAVGEAAGEHAGLDIGVGDARRRPGEGHEVEHRGRV